MFISHTHKPHLFARLSFLVMETIVLPLLSCSRGEVRRRPALLLLLLLLLLLVVRIPANKGGEWRDPFPGDILTPYPQGRHGGTRTSRDITTCLHTSWNNRTVEVYPTSTTPSGTTQPHFDLHRFADVVHRTPLRKRYGIGTVAYVSNPYYTLSILEPLRKGTCKGNHFLTPRGSVQETVANRKHGCHLAANAGYFEVTNGRCLGNIVSDGNVVQTAGGTQNANFGIREDGTIVVGYITDEEIFDQSNPYRQLVTGVIWLVRNGSNYVNESMYIECSDHEDTGNMETFVNVISARSAIGHDKDGRVVLIRVDGQTHVRGVNLFEFADILISKGVVNAINLDGGGSNTLVQDNVLVNYPSDHCPFKARYRCPREVSTVLCVHDVECLDPDCSSHGSCDLGTCSCDPPWTGRTCDVLNCSLTNCSDNGVCENGECQCNAGWWGDYCDKRCPPSKYGPGCTSYCHCYGNSICDPINGTCTCSPGYTGTWCWTKCTKGYYGDKCRHRCPYPDCSNHGTCSHINGVCLCKEGWNGPDCNSTINSEDTTIENVSSAVVNSSISPSLSLFLSSSSPSSMFTPPSLVSSVTNVQSSPSPCSYNSSNSIIPSIDNQFTVTSVALVAIVTILIHMTFFLCNVCVCYNPSRSCCSSFNKMAIKRELMERREWEREMLKAGARFDDSSSEYDDH